MYHEMIVHVPLMTHPDPKRVLIIGGGDGGTLRRVLEHPGVEATQVEIDRDVIDACREHIPSIANGAFDTTVGPEVALWRAARKTRQLPTTAAIESA